MDKGQPSNAMLLNLHGAREEAARHSQLQGEEAGFCLVTCRGSSALGLCLGVRVSVLWLKHCADRGVLQGLQCCLLQGAPPIPPAGCNSPSFPSSLQGCLHPFQT